MLNQEFQIKPKNQVHTVIANLDFLPGKKFLTDNGYIVEHLLNFD
jgi:hypothetical protein